MVDKDYKAFIVEGEAREPQVIDNISKVFFKHRKMINGQLKKNAEKIEFSEKEVMACHIFEDSVIDSLILQQGASAYSLR